ncbi:hypothetical protein SAMN05421505_12488 [Sinosporangium album]|uniref:Uncharacterized protein n=1 Tax=Sinosporangium album TaxID=504805 RepID=A0A1G8FU16_9ACTN|nr:hypothetical protein [Sinosporangium album]SDH85629.1 hypothetical protein SAMN05421505_12488 [Sinosporangium album]
MGRILLAVLGGLLALYLLFGFLIPALFATLKFLFVLVVIALVVVAGVTLVGKFSKK